MVIFDCNGVLVDSEQLAASVVSQEFMRAGFPLTADIVTRYFTGRRPIDMLHMHHAKLEAWILEQGGVPWATLPAGQRLGLVNSDGSVKRSSHAASATFATCAATCSGVPPLRSQA